MDTNDAVRTLERIDLDLQGLREDVRAQSERLAAQSERLAAQSVRTAAIETSLGRVHASLEALARPLRETDPRLERLYREAFAMSSAFTIMSERLAFAALEEAEHTRRIGDRLERIDQRLLQLGEHMQRLDGRMETIERLR